MNNVMHQSIQSRRVLGLIYTLDFASPDKMVMEEGSNFARVVSKRDFSKRYFILPQLNDTIKKLYIPLINVFLKVKYFKAQCLACRAHQHKTGPPSELLGALNHGGGL